MKTDSFKIAAVCVGVLAFAACSEAPKSASTASDNGTTAATTAEPAGPPQPVSGLTAYWRMYTSAREWAKDVMPLSLESKEVPGIKNEAGKAAMWTAMFASPSQSQARSYTFAIVRHPPDIYKGVSIGDPMPWTPSQRLAPFEMSEVATDSDAAYTVAVKDADPWLKKHPDETVSLSLRDTHQVPTWFILWGTNKSGYRALVDSMSGTDITKK